MFKFDFIDSSSMLGAIISNIDISDEISSEDKDKLKSVWFESSILIFPDQKLTHEEFENFSLIFGNFGDDPFIESIDDHPNIIEVKKNSQ